MSDPLTIVIFASHAALGERIADTTTCAYPRLARDQQWRADALLVAACRHVTSVSGVLGAGLIARDEHERAARIVEAGHALQVSMLRAKGRMYGAAQLARLPWATLWGQVLAHIDALTALERDAVAHLAACASAGELEDLAARICRAAQHAPTRPHPFIPLAGRRGRLARAVCVQLDAVWDSLEGRPTPPHALVPTPPDSGHPRADAKRRRPPLT